MRGHRKDDSKKLKSFNMSILGYDPYLDAEIAKAFEIDLVSLNELLEKSDFVFVQTLLNNETFHLIGEKEFELMKSNAYIINCARGEVVDEAAMIKALRENKMAGAGLDVFENEPPKPDNPLFKMDNVVVTPHCASWTTDAFKNLRKSVGAEAAEILNGIVPDYLVNKNVKPRFNK